MLSMGLLTLKLEIPGCASLKEKRGRLKPLITRLHREFDVSAAEVGEMDAWQSSIVACGMVSNDPDHTSRSLQKVAPWIENYWPDVTVIEEKLELR